MIETKAEMIEALERLNSSVLSKLDGLAEYDVRRPLTPTGTNLLGMVKHLAGLQAEYFGDVFERPWPEPRPWLADDAASNADMFATAAESVVRIRGFYAASWAHALATFAVTGLDDTATVPWWPPERRHPTLLALLLHMTVETARHAGHLDILREIIDGSVGRFDGDGSMPDNHEVDWVAHVAEVDAAARAAAAKSSRAE